jgi:hypothetical protein
MKKNLLINFLALAVVLAFIAPQLTNAQGKANFAGNWIYNAAKSPQPAGGPGGGGAGGGGGMGGGRGGMGGGDMVVTQDANTLSIERSRPGQDGTPVKTTTKYTLDGKETTNTTGRGESKSTATWAADGKSLTIVTKMDFNGNTMETKEVWTLTAPKTLSIASTRQGGQNGPTTTTRVYEIK